MFGNSKYHRSNSPQAHFSKGAARNPVLVTLPLHTPGGGGGSCGGGGDNDNDNNADDESGGGGGESHVTVNDRAPMAEDHDESTTPLKRARTAAETPAPAETSVQAEVLQ